jgi:hypothetical protein
MPGVEGSGTVDPSREGHGLGRKSGTSCRGASPLRARRQRWRARWSNGIGRACSGGSPIPLEGRDRSNPHLLFPERHPEVAGREEGPAPLRSGHRRTTRGGWVRNGPERGWAGPPKLRRDPTGWPHGSGGLALGGLIRTTPRIRLVRVSRVAVSRHGVRGGRTGEVPGPHAADEHHPCQATGSESRPKDWRDHRVRCEPRLVGKSPTGWRGRILTDSTMDAG